MENPQTGKKPLNGLDVGKFILSIFVVAGHTSPLKSISIFPNFILIQILARNAVPLYFMISGYLFYIKRGDSTIKIGRFTVNEYYYKYVKRMLAVYLIWSAIYLFDVLERYYYGSGMSVPVFALLYVWGATVYGTYIQLWFFPSLLFAVTMVHLFAKKIGFKKLLGIAFFFYIIGMFGDAYFGVIKDVPVIANSYKSFFFLFNTTRNGLMFGLMFVTMGAMLSEKKTLLPPKKAGLYALISLGFVAIESFSLRYLSQPIDYNVMLFLIPTAYFNFQFLLGLDLKFKWNYKFLRDSSTVIFFIHPLFVILFNVLFPIFGAGLEGVMSLVRFFFVYFLSLIFATLVVKLRTHPKLGILVKYLY